MTDFFARLFASDFMPHGACYRWSPDVVWLNVISDSLIGLAYYSIPITLFYFVRKRRDIPYTWMFLMFGGFIVACGTTHLMEVWNVWHGAYRISGVVKAVTALLSLSTAVLLLRVVPRAMALQSPEKLAAINAELQREITERKAAEEKLRQNEEFTRGWLNLTTDGIWDWNLKTDDEYLSPRFKSLFGYEDHELPNRASTWQRMIFAEDLQLTKTAFKNHVERGEPFNIPVRYHHRDGSTVWVICRGVAVRNDANEVTRMVGTHTDITSLKRVEEALKQSEARVREMNSGLERLVEARTKELRESENRLRGLFDQAAVGLAIVDLNGNWLRVNQRLCEIVGYTEEEMLRSSFQRMTHPDDLNADIAQVERLLSGEIGTYSLEKRYIRKNGSIVWIQLTASLARDDGTEDSPGAPRYFVAVVEDISARRAAQHELKETLKELTTLKSALDEHAIVAITDPRGKITYANDKFCAISKYAREELLGQDHRIINSGYHPREFIRNIWSTITSGRVWKGEICNRAKDGSIYWVDTTIVPYLDPEGKPYQYVAIRADITQRKQAEQSIYRLAAIVDSSDDAIISKHLDGRIISWNTGAERLFGYTAAEMLGQSINAIIPEDLLSEEKEIVERITRGESIQNHETVRRCKDGSFVDVSSSISPLRDSAGRVIGASKISRNITEKKRTEALTRESLREKETLLKEIHHRVKNNMQLISSLLQLQSRTISDPGTRTIFRDGQNRIRSMALIHEKLYRSSNLASIDFTEYIRSLTGILMRTYNTRSHGITIETKIEAISLNLDTSVPLGLILNELISNSLKHAFPGERRGKVEVIIRRTSDEDFEMIVRDDGVGLPAGIELRNSTSLGMRLVHILAEQLQGTLQITTDKGTVMRLNFREQKNTERTRIYAA